MTKMNLREAEQYQLGKLERYGLKRVIEYDHEPNSDRYYVVTMVTLVGEDFDGRNENLEDAMVSIGRAMCSNNDNWNKRKGRVIATARAIREYLNSRLHNSHQRSFQR